MYKFFSSVRRIINQKQYINSRRKLALKIWSASKRNNSNTPKITPFLSCELPEVKIMCPDVKNYEELHKFSLENSDKFWSTLALTRLKWNQPFDNVSKYDGKLKTTLWFSGGKLNAAVNCVDRHYEKNPSKVALIWEKDEPKQEVRITYKQLYEDVNRMSNVLRKYGVKKGDRVAVYMSTSPMLVTVMLACCRIGAVHSVVFAGFGADALVARVTDAKADVMVVSGHFNRGGKKIDLSVSVADVMKKCPDLKHVLISDMDKVPGNMVKLEDELNSAKTECEPVYLDSEDPLFILYTSGSTGKPKGIVHTQAGYLLYTSVTHKHVFNCNDNDIFCCAADIGWITGHSYAVYGPLCNGITSVLFESTPVYPDPGRYWEMVERLKCTHFYTSPTAIRLLLKHGNEYVKKYNRSTLKVLGVVGEPINSDAWQWYFKEVGEERCDVIDTWWQTETGGICIAPRPSGPEGKIFPAMPMRPFFGIEPVIVGHEGDVITEPDTSGYLCIKNEWPGAARSIWGAHQTFIETYYMQCPGFYFSGDGAYQVKDGYFKITGRVDDIMKISGRRLETAEVEDAIAKHSDVAEAAVVGFPHPTKGEGVYAYVVLKTGSTKKEEEIFEELRFLVKVKVGSFAKPEIIHITSHLPKTRSGKIMRRILRKIAAEKYDDLGDLTTLAEPDVIKEIIDKHKEIVKQVVLK